MQYLENYEFCLLQAWRSKTTPFDGQNYMDDTTYTLLIVHNILHPSQGFTYNLLCVGSLHVRSV